jgi:hypothetical protein
MRLQDGGERNQAVAAHIQKDRRVHRTLVGDGPKLPFAAESTNTGGLVSGSG